MTLEETLTKLETHRAAMRTQMSAEVVHDFARAVESLGYVDVRELERRRVDFEKLVQWVYVYYRRFLKQHPDDAAALNNIGVLLSNRGKPRRARRYFAMAVRLAAQDRNIHENLRIADILMRKPEQRWHDYPDGLQPGKHTMVAYFDPHGM